MAFFRRGDDGTSFFQDENKRLLYGLAEMTERDLRSFQRKVADLLSDMNKAQKRLADIIVTQSERIAVLENILQQHGWMTPGELTLEEQSIAGEEQRLSVSMLQ